MTSGHDIPPGTVSLSDYEALARARISENAWAYIAGGSADELTMRWNREAFDRIRLEGRVLRDMTGASTQVELLGLTLPYPILMAPVAFQRLVHSDGEIAAALGASAVGATMVVSTLASVTIEEIARAATAPLWFQLYMHHDRGFTRTLVQRAETAGYRTLVVTVDAAVSGLRNRQHRAGFRLPEDVTAVNLVGMPKPPTPQPLGPGESAIFRGLLDAAATWRDVAALVASTRLPVLLKGIVGPEDALAALDCGVAGLIVSNHGGRTLDTLPASIDVLPRIADAVGGRVPLLLDGGIRRGTDVLKAMAFGARAVMIGRPCVHGLAVAGATGVAHVLSLLRAEFEMAMALTGCASVAEIGPAAIWSADRPRPS
ncbi:(S)-mandelate dehydrogenase OS=Afipia felis OX=1035 GN=mdlB PE=3 SV=1 [Afipia felis]